LASRPEKAVQTRIFSVLNGDSVLSNLGVTGVFDRPSEDKELPYIVLGEIESEDRGSHNTSGFGGDITLRFWTNVMPKSLSYDISNRVYELLHNLDLDIQGFPTLSFRCTLNRIDEDDDGRTFQGIQRYTFLLGGNTNG